MGGSGVGYMWGRTGRSRAGPDVVGVFGQPHLCPTYGLGMRVWGTPNIWARYGGRGFDWVVLFCPDCIRVVTPDV